MINVDEILGEFNISNPNLLGDYDSKGNYKIAQKLKNELIRFNKVIVKETQNEIFCIAKSENNTYNFILTIEEKEVCAKMYLVEKDSQDAIINTPIVKYTGWSIDKFIERVKVIFRLKSEKETNLLGKEQFSLCDKYLSEKQLLYRETLNEMSQLNKKYIEEIISQLKDDAVGLDIIKTLKQKMQESEYDSNCVGFYIDAKKKLDELLKENEKILNVKLLANLLLCTSQFQIQKSKLKSKYKLLEEKRRKQYEDEVMYSLNTSKNKEKAKQKEQIEIKKVNDIQSEIDELMPWEDKNNNGILDALECSSFENFFNYSKIDNLWMLDEIGAFNLINNANIASDVLDAVATLSKF